MSQVIKQNVTLEARPSVVFEALMDSKKHAAFTGAPAKVSRKVGGEFSHHGGHIGGVNVEIAENKLIVQAWRPKGWPKGTWSLATFALAPLKGGKTKLSFTHPGIPAAHVKSITSGWKAHYWQPLKAWLKEAGATTKAKPKPAAAARKPKKAAVSKREKSRARG